jgi:hypothetical protein
MSTSIELAPQERQQIEQGTAIAQRCLAEAAQITVTDAETARLAAEWLRNVKATQRAHEQARTFLVKPLNDHVKAINDQFRPLTQTLEEAERTVKGKLLSFQRDAEVRRLREQARLDAERHEREQAAERERREIEEAARYIREGAAREAEAAQQRARGEADEFRRSAAEQQAQDARERERQAQEAERSILIAPPAQVPAAVAEGAPALDGVATRKRWAATVTDETLMPREYLRVDVRAINEAVRQGVREIPGVRIEQVDNLAVRS